ncbi:MAG: PDZ domain-containing protein, partial [Planctomycetaceae bacterium]
MLRRSGWLATAGLLLAAVGFPATAQQDAPPQERPQTPAEQPNEQPANEQPANEQPANEQPANENGQAPTERPATQRPSERPPMGDPGSPTEQSRERAPHGALGIVFENTPNQEQQGVLVLGVALAGPAAQAGLQAGDRIVSFDGRRVETPDALIELIKQKRPGAKVQIEVMRDDKPLTLQTAVQSRSQAFDEAVDRGEFPSGPGSPQMRMVTKPFLGVMFSDDDRPQEPGVRITDIYPGGPADEGGLRAGDVLLKIGETQVGTSEEASRAIEKLQPDVAVAVRVRRDGNEQMVPVHVGQYRTYEPIGADSGPGRVGPIGDGMSDSASRVEQFRRLAQQNQRVERLLLQLMSDVQALQQEVSQLRGGAAQQPAQPPQQIGPVDPRQPQPAERPQG